MRDLSASENDVRRVLLDAGISESSLMWNRSRVLEGSGGFVLEHVTFDDPCDSETLLYYVDADPEDTDTPLAQATTRRMADTLSPYFTVVERTTERGPEPRYYLDIYVKDITPTELSFVKGVK